MTIMTTQHRASRRNGWDHWPWMSERWKTHDQFDPSPRTTSRKKMGRMLHFSFSATIWRISPSPRTHRWSDGRMRSWQETLNSSSKKNRAKIGDKSVLQGAPGKRVMPIKSNYVPKLIFDGTRRNWPAAASVTFGGTERMRTEPNRAELNPVRVGRERRVSSSSIRQMGLIND